MSSNYEFSSDELKLVTEAIAWRAPHISTKLLEDIAGNILLKCAKEHYEIDSGDTKGAHKSINNKVSREIRELTGFSSYEIGVLVTEAKGGFSQATNARTIVDQKNGLGEDAEQNGNLERARVMRPISKRKFLATYPELGLTDHHEAWADLKEAINGDGIPGHDWMRGVPGGLFSTNEGKLWVVDFTCPASQDRADVIYDVPGDERRAGLGMLKLQMEALGYEVEKTILCVTGISDMKIRCKELSISPKLLQTIKDVGDRYWNENVLKNEAPEFNSTKTFSSVSDVSSNTLAKISELSGLSILIRNAEAKKDSTKRSLLELLAAEGVDLSSSDTTRVPLVDIRKMSKRTLSKDLLLEKIQEISPGIDVDQFYSNTQSTVIANQRSKTGEYAHILDDLKNISQDVMSDMYSDIRSAISMYANKMADESDLDADLRAGEAKAERQLELSGTENDNDGINF